MSEIKYVILDIRYFYEIPPIADGSLQFIIM